ncbi:alkylation response protein AidB-like acyl-CoA dehydrogenase [Sphingomonas sp. SORGH_AS802]|uniref:acyl-CoA dehydrogenase C-terminal domain-containing protein n=1 Tax=unclassified Sphingomonas TaxID=196159 RepID=UPI0028602474|nr:MULTISPECIES: acyl-CoA dehydrogenase C-terminal domain-containing protein [unclassified Sphingomonas]MDR6128305.1 alkylation response protein AidB-like acyl-CoA dehydrogenase [Sphingomonas sp. SORGH_AS_0438]MDR6135491.1 alkylation response protein AidB-like acyl-CoA dehydrogenase [Sphingomonas sp. SORGH_AS_0802]
MQVYTAPLRDMRFVLHELFADQPFGPLALSDDFTPDLYDAILEEAARMAQEVLLPLNASGDLEGCTYENGVVRTPKGFPEAYARFREGGWAALSSDPRWGGQGLPETVNKLVEEMTCSANLSFGLYPGLTHGATTAIEGHGSDALKQAYLPKMVSGEWAGTMCLTESHCGTDLGLLRTRAVPQADGSYAVTGSKIFISSGDHDLTDNIVHLVLARLPDAPAGVKGISLFLVPKFLPKDDGSPGARNGVAVAGIEHKMGLKASATCQMNFDGATGWLVGEPNRGLAAMFTMMNTERVSVGVQGLGVGEIAYQSAVAYARDRLQGRALTGPARPDLPADPIIVHPDVRRMLMTMRVYAEGCRALGQWTSQALDAEKHGTDPEGRARATDFVALMTPVVKALFTDLASEAANLAVQTYGGHGYIREHGVEQFVRDARICQIYEGTNGVQALDLLGRKMPANMGRALRPFFHSVSGLLEELTGTADKVLGIHATALHQAFGALQLTTGMLAQKGLKDPDEIGAAATDYLRMLGLVGIGYCFLKAERIAQDRLAEGTEDEAFYRAKLATAGFFFDRILPQATTGFLVIKSGKRSTMALPADAF